MFLKKTFSSTDCRLAKIVSKQDIDPAPMPAELIDNLGKKLIN